MPPNVTAHDLRHVSNLEPECESKGAIAFPRSGAGTNCQHIPIRQLGFVVRRAMRHPSFADRIIHILLGCAEKQMVRSHAMGGIAPMTHIDAFGDWTKRPLVGEAMRLTVDTMLPAEYPVAISHTCRRPEPAAIRARLLVDLFEEPLNGRARARDDGHMSAHIAMLPQAHVMGPAEVAARDGPLTIRDRAEVARMRVRHGSLSLVPSRGCLPHRPENCSHDFTKSG